MCAERISVGLTCKAIDSILAFLWHGYVLKVLTSLMLI